ncbi:hypothetical protein R1sor_019138 [Riccia sorocarpa]|uniref:RING-type E3 ubiquitin transferase n=1 Tax=Riccia sorocarpa TaxID=122646 RepID=A0ABD3ICS7_9MARC
MSHYDDELRAIITRLALAGDGFVLGLGMAVLAVRTWVKFRSHSKALKEVQETPLTSIADLRSLILGDNDKSSSETQELILAPRYSTISSKDLFTKSRKTVGKSPGQGKEKLVMVRGRIYTTPAGDPRGRSAESELLHSESGNQKGVYLERTQTCLYNEWRGIFGWGYEWKGLLGWGSLAEQVTLSRRKVPFVLVGSKASKPSEVYVHVELDDPPKHPLPLVTVYHKLHPVPASSYTFFQALFGRRYPVGLLDEEKILPVGQEVTAVGLIRASADGDPIIYSSQHLPCFLTGGTREQLLTELANGTRVLMWSGIAMSTVALGILGYAFMKNWTKYKARQRERLRREEDRRQDSLPVEYESEDLTEVPDGELCIVCLLRRRRAAFIFCGHRVCCVGCAQRVEQGPNPRCPVCRQEVNGYVRVYDS